MLITDKYGVWKCSNQRSDFSPWTQTRPSSSSYTMVQQPPSTSSSQRTCWLSGRVFNKLILHRPQSFKIHLFVNGPYDLNNFLNLRSISIIFLIATDLLAIRQSVQQINFTLASKFQNSSKFVFVNIPYDLNNFLNVKSISIIFFY